MLFYSTNAVVSSKKSCKIDLKCFNNSFSHSIPELLCKKDFNYYIQIAKKYFNYTLNSCIQNFITNINFKVYFLISSMVVFKFVSKLHCFSS